MDVVEEFRKIWDLAEELAEREAAQFERAPYRRILRGVGEAYERSRLEYKDEMRQKHVMAMMVILRGEDPEI